MTIATRQAESVELSGTVTDQTGAPLADVAVAAVPIDNDAKQPDTRKALAMRLDQKGRAFIPHVLAVAVGTPVYFPNSDDIQHHVYSFSTAKRFEIKLYRGMPSQPIVFDKSGIAVLGCNIHDWMLAYVYVADTRHVTQTDAAGHWQVALPEGRYHLTLWHPDASVPEALPNQEPVTVPTKPLQHVIEILAQPITGNPPDNRQMQGYKDGF